MNILVITQKVDSEDPILGFFHAWLAELGKQCEAVSVISLSVGKNRLPGTVSLYSLGKERGKKSRIMRSLRFLRLIIALRKNYDAVLVHMNPEYIVLGGFVWRLLGKRIVLWYAHKSVSRSLRIATALADRVLTSTPEGFRLQSPKVRIIGQGIDTGLFSDAGRVPRSEVSLVSVSRLSPVKRVEISLEVLSILIARGVPARLSIVGDAALASDEAYAAQLKRQAAEPLLASRISFLGALPQRDTAKVLSEGDFFVHDARNGSLDKAVLEASLCGVLVVSSNDAVRQLLPEELRFTPGSAEEAASRIMALIREPGKREELRKKQRAMVVHDHELGAFITKVVTHLHA